MACIGKDVPGLDWWADCCWSCELLQCHLGGEGGLACRDYHTHISYALWSDAVEVDVGCRAIEI